MPNRRNAPPTIAVERLWHVGEMDASLKGRDSYEGCGLSVSVHPGEWRSIARGLVTGPCWEMTHAGASLLDAHALGRTRRRGILAWGVAAGLAEETTAWRWTRFDDELDCSVSHEFASPEEARDEADGDGTIRRVASHRSTPTLDAAAMQSRPTLSSGSVIDLLLPIWAREIHGLDGVWWEDRLDVLAYSAPRGVIHPDAVAGWTATRLDSDPEAEDDDDDD